MAEAETRIQGAPPKAPVQIAVGIAFIICDLLFFGVHWLFVFIGLPLAIVGALILAWQFAGREEITLDADSLVIEARIGRTTASYREFAFGELTAARERDGLVWVAPWSASGLPRLIAGSAPTVWFDYRKKSYAFGQSLSSQQKAQVLGMLQQPRSAVPVPGEDRV